MAASYSCLGTSKPNLAVSCKFQVVLRVGGADVCTVQMTLEDDPELPRVSPLLFLSRSRRCRRRFVRGSGRPPSTRAQPRASTHLPQCVGTLATSNF